MSYTHTPIRNGRGVFFPPFLAVPLPTQPTDGLDAAWPMLPKSLVKVHAQTDGEPRKPRQSI